MTGATIINLDRVADVYVLHLYELERSLLGHDFGGGQRRQELNRQIRRLTGDECSAFTAAVQGTKVLPVEELRAACARVGGPKAARLKREAHRHGTMSTRLSWKAWETVARLCHTNRDRIVEVAS